MAVPDLVEVACYGNRIEAEMAVARLEADGIEAFAKMDDGGGAYPVLDLTSGVRVMVAAEDEERARISLGN